MFRLPSPSLIISMLALVIALGGAGYSATGGNFILGKTNGATTQTKLLAPIPFAAFRVDNTSTAAGATGIRIVTNAARSPLVVSSSTKVTNLNADQLDGIDSSNLTRRLVVPFDLGPGGVSAPIGIPDNRPVYVMGVTLTDSDRAVGQVTLLRIPDTVMSWVGLNSCCNAGTLPVVRSGTDPGDSIVFIDNAAQVELELNDVNSIRVNNASFGQRNGTVTLLW